MKSIHRYCIFVIAHPKIAILGILICTMAAGFFAKDVRLDNNFAALFSTKNNEMKFRDEYRSVFGADDNLLVALLKPRDPNNSQFSGLLEELSNQVEGLQGIQKVYSLTETSLIKGLGEEIWIAPAFGQSSPLSHMDYAERIQLVQNSSFLGQGRLISPDGKWFLVLGEMNDDLDTYEEIREPAALFTDLVDRLLDQKDVKVDVLYAGIAFTRIAAIQNMQGDLIRLAPLTSMVVAFLLLVFFKTWRGMILPMLSMGICIVLTAGIIGACGDHLNQLTIIYPVLLMVVVAAGAIHLLYRFEAEHSKEGDLKKSVYIAAVRVTKANMLASFTTSVGFFSLVFANMEVLHTFGIYLGAGVALSFFVNGTMIPALLVILKPKPRVMDRKSSMDLLCREFGRWLIQPKISIGVSSLGVLLLFGCVYTSMFAEYDYSLSGMLNPEHPIAKGNAILDQDLAGMVPLEISFRGRSNDFIQPEHLQRMDQLALWLKEHHNLSQPISIAELVKELHREFTGSYTIPKDKNAVSQLLLFASNSSDKILQQLITDDYSQARMRSNSPDLGARAIVSLADDFNTYSSKIFEGTNIEVKMTGEAPVAYRGMNSLSKELVISVLLALITIVLTIGMTFLSPKLALASVLPNVLPIGIGMAFYSLSGEVIDPLPGIAFCISLGISVDDTVHMISKYLEGLETGLSGHSAILNAISSLSGSLICSTVVLMGGFAVLTLSSFSVNRTLGMLGCSLIFLALVCDFLFVPALLNILPLRKEKASTKGINYKNSLVGSHHDG